jgi:hypothetical protein
MSDIYTLLQGQEPALDGFDYHRITAGGVIDGTNRASIALTTIDGRNGVAGLTIPANAWVTQAALIAEDALIHGTAAGVLKLAAAVNTDATVATAIAVSTAAAVSTALSFRTANALIAPGAPVSSGGSALVLQLFAATLANGSGAASTIRSANGRAVPVGVVIWYAQARNAMQIADTGFYSQKSLSEAITQTIGPS